MKAVTSILPIAVLLLCATASTATVTLTASGQIVSGANAGNSDLSLAVAGDQVRVDISINNTGSAVAGLTLSAAILPWTAGTFLGDANAALRFDGGSSSVLWFVETRNKFGAPTGGVMNIRGTSNGADGTYTSITLPLTLGPENIANGLVHFFNGANPANPATGSGQLDFGISPFPTATGPGGTPGVDFVAGGAFHAVLFFTLNVNSEVLLGLNGFGGGGGLIDANGQDFIGDEIQIGSSVIPEPTAAFCLALGMAGLGATRPRR